MTWLMANGGTIIVLAVLILIVALIVRKLHADKKKAFIPAAVTAEEAARGAHSAAEAVPLALRTRNKQC